MRDSSRALRALADLAPPDSGDGSPEKLSVPGGEVVTAVIENDSDQDEQDDVSSYEGWDYSRPTAYAPSHDGLSTCLAPHVKTLPLHSGSITSAPAILSSTTSMGHGGPRSSKRPPGSEPASAPRFLVRVSSNSTEIHDQVILDRTNLPQDLIFSIVLEQSEINQYLLMELTIDIALGSNDPTYFLMSTYTGPGAHMLTNLRFNVIPTTFHDMNHNQYYLRIRLLPRAEKGWVIAPAVNELSFLLGLASINAPRGGFGSTTATIQSRARYCRNPAMVMDDINIMIVENPPVSVTVAMQ